MLVNLHVKNLAIIDEVEVDFSDRLNVLTGETGAGKSIIIGSINLALGQKSPKDVIRKGGLCSCRADLPGRHRTSACACGGDGDLHGG